MQADRSTEIAWAAGLFEGEGSFGAYKCRTTWNVTAQIMMTDLDVLERFASVVGIGKAVLVPRSATTSGRKQIYRWRVNGKADTRYVIALLLPWLCSRRRAKALEVDAIAATIRDQSTPRSTHCNHGHEYTAPNTIWQSNGTRRCRTCRQRWQRNNYRKRVGSPPERWKVTEDA